MQSPESPPLVTVGIPLYRSRRFVPVIAENIRAIDYPNIEIIVSDRHGLDDAIDEIERLFPGDPRLRYLRASDERDWVENYNVLLDAARGEYFLWMAHDDSYSGNYISDLVAALEVDPDAVLAFGRVDRISVDGFLPVKSQFVPPRLPADRGWPFWMPFHLLMLWEEPWVPFRGLLRKAAVDARALRMRKTESNPCADVCWVFGLSLIGRIGYVPTCVCTKRFYGESTGAQWQHSVRTRYNEFRAQAAYVKNIEQRRWRVLPEQTALFLFFVARTLSPKRIRKPLRSAIRSIVGSVSR